MFFRKFVFSTLRTTSKSTIFQHSRPASSIKVPCLPFTLTDNSRINRYQVWRITSLLVHTRQSHYELKGVIPDFMHWSEIWKEYFSFYVCMKVTFTRQFYAVVSEAFWKRPVPHQAMNVHMKTGYIGSKSGSFVSTLEYKHHDNLTPDLDQKGAILLKNGQLALAECIISFVVVDKQTRKAVSPPKWWLEEYQKKSDLQYKLGPLKVVDIPKKKDYYSHQIVARWNDSDSYKHVNYQIYMQYCLEAANNAVNDNFFKDGFNCKGDIFNRDVKEFVVNYVRESLPGDKLNVYLWRGAKNQTEEGAKNQAKEGAKNHTEGGAKNQTKEGADGSNTKNTNNNNESNNDNKNNNKNDDNIDLNTIHFSIEKQASKNRLSTDVICQASFVFFPTPTIK